MAPVPFVDLAAQRQALGEEIDQVVAAALERTDWILGRDVTAFEEEFAAYCDSAYAIGVDSGMSALELALRALGVGPGDEVITQANTFVATAFSISATGATLRLVDVDPDLHTLDPAGLERAITSRTKAVVPVHLYGQPADMDAIAPVARAHGLAIVEDACQAHGARLGGRRAGSLGDAAAFSFYPSKNLGAYGDGGAITTNDPGVRESVLMLRNYGQRQKYHHEVLAYNRRLDTLQAAVLRVKLRRLDEWNAARRRHADAYRDLLSGCDAVLPLSRPGVEHVWHLYVVQVNERDAVLAALGAAGIDCGIHYPVPVHLQPAYRDLGYPLGSFPVSEAAAERILSLPMFPELTAGQLERVASALRDAVADAGALPAAAGPAGGR